MNSRYVHHSSFHFLQGMFFHPIYFINLQEIATMHLSFASYFISRHIPAVLVDLDLIPHAWLKERSAIRCSNLHRANVHLCTVVALVDVLVEIFDSRNRGADLHVDVAVEE